MTKIVRKESSATNVLSWRLCWKIERLEQNTNAVVKISQEIFLFWSVIMKTVFMKNKFNVSLYGHTWKVVLNGGELPTPILICILGAENERTTCTQCTTSVFYAREVNFWGSTSQWSKKSQVMEPERHQALINSISATWKMPMLVVVLCNRMTQKKVYRMHIMAGDEGIVVKTFWLNNSRLKTKPIWIALCLKFLRRLA